MDWLTVLLRKCAVKGYAGGMYSSEPGNRFGEVRRRGGTQPPGSMIKYPFPPFLKTSNRVGDAPRVNLFRCVVLKHNHVDHLPNLVTNLVVTTSSLEPVVAKVGRSPLYIVALVVHPHCDSFEDLHLATLQILKIVDVFVATFLFVACVGIVHQLVKQTLANALANVSWVHVQGELRAEPVHRSCTVGLKMYPSGDGFTHRSCSRLLTLVTLCDCDEARQACFNDVANPVANLHLSLLFNFFCAYRILDVMVVDSLYNI
jgi:hypothetical protein